MVTLEKQKQPYITPEKYLEQESRAETKSEYFDGYIVAMAGASLDHNTINFNLIVEIGTQLRGRPCQGMSSDMRVKVSECNHYYYPDMIVVCNEPQIERVKGVETLLNPTMVIEVLSESTELTDRGEKLASYRTLASLQTYVLVTQKQLLIEAYTRLPDGTWRYQDAKGVEGALHLESIGVNLRLADIYARVQFSATPTAQEAEEEPDGNLAGG